MSRIRRATAGLVLVVGVVLASSSVASAATITVTPDHISPGDTVRLTGDVLAGGVPGCAVPSDVTLISQVFVGLGEFAGVPAVNAPVDASGNFDKTVTINRAVFAGSYEITGRCGGGNLGVVATLVVGALPATGPSFPIAASTAISSLLVLIGAACVVLPRRRRPAL